LSKSKPKDRPKWRETVQEMIANRDARGKISPQRIDSSPGRLEVSNRIDLEKLITESEESALLALQRQGFLCDRTVEQVTLDEIASLLHGLDSRPPLSSNAAPIGDSRLKIRRCLDTWLWIFHYRAAVEQNNIQDAVEAMHIITIRFDTVPLLELSALAASRVRTPEQKALAPRRFEDRDKWGAKAYEILAAHILADMDPKHPPRRKYSRAKFYDDLDDIVNKTPRGTQLRVALQSADHFRSPDSETYLNALVDLSKDRVVEVISAFLPQ
jgi:hypothetical protein